MQEVNKKQFFDFIGPQDIIARVVRKDGDTFSEFTTRNLALVGKITGSHPHSKFFLLQKHITQ